MMEEIKRLLEQLRKSGVVDPDLLDRLARLNDPGAMDEALSILKKLGGPELEAPLNAEDYYQEGDGSRFELLWPLGPDNPIHRRDISFSELDRKTQFYVLFGDWSYWEAKGMLELSGGDLDGAERIFEECLARAEQIAVAELQARSYEGMMRVAQKRGDQDAALKFSRKAQSVRGKR